MSDVDLEWVITAKGKFAHHRHKAGQRTLCGARGPFSVITKEEALKRGHCQSCQRRATRAKPKLTQGDVSYEAAGEPLTPLSRDAMASLRNYAEIKRATPAPQTLA